MVPAKEVCEECGRGLCGLCFIFPNEDRYKSLKRGWRRRIRKSSRDMQRQEEETIEPQTKRKRNKGEKIQLRPEPQR